MLSLDCLMLLIKVIFQQMLFIAPVQNTVEYIKCRWQCSSALVSTVAVMGLQSRFACSRSAVPYSL